MKTNHYRRGRSRLLLVCGVLAFAAFTLRTEAQFAIAWYKVSGGGGVSANAPYTVKGTIGQHDAGGPMVGGTFTVTGGFWAVAIQTPGSPLLTIQLTAPNTAVVSWPAPSPGFHLQMNANITTTNWVNVVNPVTTINGRNQVTINPLPGNDYYRLVKP
jgi:hypothetical protein